MLRGRMRVCGRGFFTPSWTPRGKSDDMHRSCTAYAAYLHPAANCVGCVGLSRNDPEYRMGLTHDGLFASFCPGIKPYFRRH